MNITIQSVQLHCNVIIFSLSNKEAFTHFVKNQKVMIDSIYSYNIQYICLLVSRLRTNINM